MLPRFAKNPLLLLVNLSCAKEEFFQCTESPLSKVSVLKFSSVAELRDLRLGCLLFKVICCKKGLTCEVWSDRLDSYDWVTRLRLITFWLPCRLSLLLNCKYPGVFGLTARFSGIRAASKTFDLRDWARLFFCSDLFSRSNYGILLLAVNGPQTSGLTFLT